MNDTARGVDRNLTNYADAGFSRYLRRAFLASAGYDGADLERPDREAEAAVRCLEVGYGRLDQVRFRHA